jgi:hypothetical protein
MINENRLIQWMNTIRNHSGTIQYRILESFWGSQIRSKTWLIKMALEKNILNGPIYIFGGWYGVLGGMIADNTIDEKIYSIDLDESTEAIGNQLNPDINFVIQDMKNFEFNEMPRLIINTSTEHISQETYDIWFSKLPATVPIILQGNNFFSCEEHIRCSSDLEQFKKDNYLDSFIFEGTLDCNEFNRYMTIGFKL